MIIEEFARWSEQKARIWVHLERVDRWCWGRIPPWFQFISILASFKVTNNKSQMIKLYILNKLKIINVERNDGRGDYWRSGFGRRWNLLSRRFVYQMSKMRPVVRQKCNQKDKN